MEKIIVNNDILGHLWVVGWLFTIGFLKLPTKRIIFGILLWPYYLGLHYSKVPGEHRPKPKHAEMAEKAYEENK